MAFKEQLIQRRKRLGLSQEQLGHRIGVSRQAVSKWELGETTPELEKLVQLSHLFGCSIDQLVENQSGEQEPKPEEPDPNPRPERGHFGPWGPWQYEYKSSRTLFGLPLVHIHIGYGLCTAKGVFALGNCARGIFALGGLSFGLVSLGGFALGLLFAFGGLAVGTVAVGGFALGLLALGGGAVGVYAIGGGAFASRVAAGGWACGPVAIGEQTRGLVCLEWSQGFESEAVRQAILTQFPGTWKIILNLFSLL